MLGGDGDRVLHHAAFVALDFGDLGGLGARRHVLVDDPDSSLLCQRNGQAGFGDGVHGGGQQRDVDLNRAGKPALEADVAGHDSGMGRQDGNVVESERPLNHSHAGRPRKDIYYTRASCRYRDAGRVRYGPGPEQMLWIRLLDEKGNACCLPCRRIGSGGRGRRDEPGRSTRTGAAGTRSRCRRPGSGGGGCAQARALDYSPGRSETGRTGPGAARTTPRLSALRSSRQSRPSSVSSSSATTHFRVGECA